MWLDAPVVPFCAFLFGVPLLKPNIKNKGTLIIKGLLGNLGGQTDIVTLLLAAGFKEAMIKALLFTIIQNRVDMLRLLLDAGVQRRDLRIACQAASNEQKHDIVQVLLGSC